MKWTTDFWLRKDRMKSTIWRTSKKGFENGEDRRKLQTKLNLTKSLSLLLKQVPYKRLTSPICLLRNGLRTRQFIESRV